MSLFKKLLSVIWPIRTEYLDLAGSIWADPVDYQLASHNGSFLDVDEDDVVRIVPALNAKSSFARAARAYRVELFISNQRLLVAADRESNLLDPNWRERDLIEQALADWFSSGWTNAYIQHGQEQGTPA